ncbi:MAG TPA: Ni/Fe-hydrogenase cytochrome b subunit [Thermoanaerobaculia bacterium]|nr:Ni/Fe-hydrogenase cytochrome b subunit [Thermoanaerobaculia bacterium]
MSANAANGLPERPGASLLAFLRQEMKPKGKLLTPFNVITVAIMLAAAVILYFRFTQGLGSVTNLSQEFPWGLWIGFDVMTGVAFAGGAYILCFLVYILRLEKYHAIVRVTVLNGFLAYVFYAGALLLDLGRPWKVVNPIIGNDFGLTSVLFLVAWHFMLYMMAELVEFSPAIAEWLGWKRIRRVLAGLTIGTVILGVSLSTLHQSALGALFLMTEPKLHPLWYSEFIPILFFVSSIFAGLSLVIFEGSITHKVFHHRASPELHRSHGGIVVSLARIAGGAMFVYLALEMIKFVHGQKWRYLEGGWGTWYLVEILGCVALPMILLIAGSRRRDLLMIRVGALLTLVGVVLNRLNISVIAFKWYEPIHYVPTWMEIVVTAAVISAELWVFRWVINRMPVLGPEPAWAEAARATAPAAPAALPAAGPSVGPARA